MREIPKYLLSVILLVLFGCSESENMQDDASPTGEVSFLTLSAVCSTYDLEIDVDEDWQIEYEAGWIFISQDEMSGVGRKTIQFYVEQNSREEVRGKSWPPFFKMSAWEADSFDPDCQYILRWVG